MRGIAPGGWISTTGIDLTDRYPFCAYCSGPGSPGWLHIPTDRILCVACLPDPRVFIQDEKTGERVSLGERAAARLRRILRRERDERAWEATIW